MHRPWRVLTAFAVCAAIVLATMAWVSVEALRLDRADQAARQKATLEETVRLALWRMDSALAVVIAEENGRPYSAYQPGSNFGGRISRGAAAPPALANGSPNVLLYFQIEADGEITSPQVSTDGPSTGGFQSGSKAARQSEAPEQTAARLLELRASIEPQALVSAARRNVKLQTAQAADDAKKQTLVQTQSPARYEQQLRGSLSRKLADSNLQLGNYFEPTDEPATATIMAPIWIGDRLLLVRQVDYASGEVIQGAWLDWPVIRANLLDSVRDLLPNADLQSVRDADTNARDDSRLLASLPVRLVEGGVSFPVQASLSPMGATLAVAWLAVLLAVVAVAVLVIGIVTLSERRAAFVSAVTHELRTPLTTFRLYTDMLDEGRVTDEAKRRGYVHTLRREAGRLANLIENVLSFARLERGRGIAAIERIAAGELIERVGDRLADRARQTGMSLHIEMGDAADAVACADPSAVERILFNLVENACRYASSAANKRIDLSVEASAGRLFVRVRDFGPGIDRNEARRLFHPFRRLKRSTADATGGVGLGLTLSRRLARQMGGDLRLESPSGQGACFVLAVPLA